MQPKLRFKEFKETWKPQSLNTYIESIQSGKSTDRSDIGRYPLYGSTGKIGYTDKPEYSGLAILIARVGANAGSKYLVNGEYSVTDNTLILRLKDSGHYHFFSYLLEWKKLNKLAFGSGQPLVTGSLLKQLKLNIPSLSEQNKIANFLTAIDAKVSLLTQKHGLLKSYKKGVMQKIFNQEIRFIDKQKHFSEWKETMLSELLSEAKVRNYDNKYTKNQVLSVSGEHGVVNQVKHLGRSYAGASISNYHVLETGGVVYTKSPLKEYPYGIIKVNLGDPGVVSTLYATYKCKPNTSGRLIDYYFQSKTKINNYLHPLVKIGAKNDMKVNNAYVLTGKIFFPTSYEEQIKIVSLLSSIDEKISNVQKELELTKRYKQGLLQQMFI